MKVIYKILFLSILILALSCDEDEPIQGPPKITAIVSTLSGFDSTKFEYQNDQLISMKSIVSWSPGDTSYYDFQLIYSLGKLSRIDQKIEGLDNDFSPKYEIKYDGARPSVITDLQYFGRTKSDSLIYEDDQIVGMRIIWNTEYYYNCSFQLDSDENITLIRIADSDSSFNSIVQLDHDDSLNPLRLFSQDVQVFLRFHFDGELLNFPAYGRNNVTSILWNSWEGDWEDNVYVSNQIEYNARSLASRVNSTHSGEISSFDYFTKYYYDFEE